LPDFGFADVPFHNSLQGMPGQIEFPGTQLPPDFLDGFHAIFLLFNSILAMRITDKFGFSASGPLAGLAVASFLARGFTTWPPGERRSLDQQPCRQNGPTSTVSSQEYAGLIKVGGFGIADPATPFDESFSPLAVGVVDEKGKPHRPVGRFDWWDGGPGDR